MKLALRMRLALLAAMPAAALERLLVALRDPREVENDRAWDEWELGAQDTPPPPAYVEEIARNMDGHEFEGCDLLHGLTRLYIGAIIGLVATGTVAGLALILKLVGVLA